MLAFSELVQRLQEKQLESPEWFNPTVALSTVLAATVLLYYTQQPKKQAVPCPESTLPVIGNLLDSMKKQRDRLYDWMNEECLRQNGNVWELRIPGRPRSVISTSPDIFEDVLARQNDVFPKGEAATSVIRDFFGRGIIAVDGAEWFFQRKTASHLFSLQMMRDVMSDVIREKIELFHDVLVTHVKQNPKQALSMRHTLTHFTSDVFAKIGFGVELDCLKRSLEGDHSNEFVDAFSYCGQIHQRRLQQPFWLWKLKRYFNLGEEKPYKESLKIVDEIILNIITKSVTNKNSGLAQKEHAQDLITLFLESHVERDGIETDVQLIRDMVVNFVFAGKDTTANAMSWFILMMNQYPDVAEKIRAEIRLKAPWLGQGELLVPTLEDLKDLTYLDAAIHENLRLNPPIAITARTSNAPTTLSDGTFINKGDRVVLMTYAQARQPTVWGEDAAMFKPERWIDSETGHLKTFSPFKFSSFLAGPRICIGRKFAMLEMKITLAVLMSRFEFTTVDDPFSITYDIALTCPVKGPLDVIVRPLC
ncbi:hypothetical protein Poli38472_012098 [Pythium oligandrum]|uniref:Cytochrome P450 n=1 Tax=Pythium oligandrum TaxID=41045 RepID=A0A8K1CNU2_PYTOL|nr:hypothetical protein Poli38472_012098 [Pythium oligandrum]|eukprot:TMW66982.1 hypothetical protein Poli38472_012098 [Pythium oligandrum]